MTEKKFTKWLRGRNAGKIVAWVLVPVALFLFLTGGVTSADAYDDVPVKFTPDTPHGTYCYIDAQYIAEPHAEKTEDGIPTTDYYYVADEDFNWVVISAKPSRYEEFAELIEYTYDFEADVAPQTIRFAGNIETMEPDLASLSREFYAEYIAADSSDIPSNYILVPGMGNSLKSGLVTMGLGGIVMLVQLLLAFTGTKRRKNAKNTIAALKASGAVEDVIADIDSPQSIPCKLPNEISGGNVLGDKYVILFTSGKVLTYDQLSGLKINAIRGENQMVANARELQVIDTSGKSYQLLVDSIPANSSDDSLAEEAIEHITKRNPNCKLV